MTLAQWRESQVRSGRKLTLAQIARAVGIASPESVRRHLEGTRRPRAATMRAYRRYTKGKVDIADWFSKQRNS